MNDLEISKDINPLDALAEDFVVRYRNGERPALSEYTVRYPELAEEILELFPALVLMEDARPGVREQTDGFLGVSSTASGKKLERLGDYRILREVGRGGMGIVYEAEQESLGRHVALKVLPLHSLLNPRHLQRFDREARAAARLHHTNIVPVFGIGEQDGLHYYVMQFIQGQGLDEVLVELKRLRKAGHLAQAGVAVPIEGIAPSSHDRHPCHNNRSAVQVAQALLSGQFCSTPEGAPESLGLSAVVPQQNNDSGAVWDTAAISPTHPADTDPSLRVHPASDNSSSTIHLPGQTAHTSLSDTGREFWHGVARVGVQVADALAYAHSQGLLHRDIKPSNLLLDMKGNVWVTDFGLARDSDEVELTQSGDIVGTLRYIAPERLQGLSDGRSDVYSLGMTMYELLTLRPAFEERDRNQLLRQLAQFEPPRPRSIDANVPRDLETIALKAIEKEPARRYTSASELAEDLRRYLADQPVHARRSAVWERAWRLCRRNPVVAGLSGVVATLMVVAIVILAVGNARIRREAAAKDAAIIIAQKAVDQMLRRVASNKLSDVPLAHPLRESLLNDAVAFYEGLVSKGVADVSIRESMAATLHELGIIQRELARYDVARQSLQRSIDLWKGLAITDPRSAIIRENLADTQEDLAFTVWKIRTGPPGSNDREAETYFLQALQTFSDLERDWPDRRQPIGHCLRQLAQFAFKRGELTAAERLLRETIAEEEAFLKQNPGHTSSRIGLCWACAQLDEQILSGAPEKAAEAESVLKTGLYHVGLMLDENPRLTRARDVSAFLHFGLGRCFSRSHQVQDAVQMFQTAAAQVGSLCAESPWNEGHWTNACYFHGASVKCLQQNGEADEAKKFVRHVVGWFRDVAPHVPRQPGPQAQLVQCRNALVALLSTTEQPAEADALSKFDLGQDAK